MQHPANGLLRISLLRTRVNKGRRGGSATCTAEAIGSSVASARWGALSRRGWVPVRASICSYSVRARSAPPSPRLSCFSQRCADLVEVLQDLFVGLEHAGLVVRDGVIPAEAPDDRLRFFELVTGQPREEMVFDLVVEAAVPEVGYGVGYDVATR